MHGQFHSTQGPKYTREIIPASWQLLMGGCVSGVQDRKTAILVLIGSHVWTRESGGHRGFLQVVMTLDTYYMRYNLINLRRKIRLKHCKMMSNDKYHCCFSQFLSLSTQLLIVPTSRNATSKRVSKMYRKRDSDSALRGA